LHKYILYKLKTIINNTRIILMIIIIIIIQLIIITMVEPLAKIF